MRSVWNERSLLAVVTCAVLASGVAQATENGNEEYPIGVNTVLPGIQPPPGHTEYYDYFAFYDAGSDVGANGSKAVPGFHVNVVANAFRVLHTWDINLGPISFTSGIVVPLVHLDIDAAGHSGSDWTLGDIDLQTLYVDYHNQTHTLFGFGGLDIYLPTGHYNSQDLANVGLNYTTFMPNGGVTWFVSPRLQLSLETSFMVDTTNNATHYHSGSSIDFDTAADYNLFPSIPKLYFGIQGYAFQQVTGDTVDGKLFDNGYYGRVLAIGPQIRYDWKAGGIALKFQHEFLVENHPQGDRIWLQFALPIS
jgi:hypothetical protein